MNQPLTSPDSARQNLSRCKNFWSEPQLQLRRVRTERARRSLKEFVTQAWPILETDLPEVLGLDLDWDWPARHALVCYKTFLYGSVFIELFQAVEDLSERTESATPT